MHSQNSQTTYDDKRVISSIRWYEVDRIAIFTCSFHCSLYLDLHSMSRFKLVRLVLSLSFESFFPDDSYG